MSAARQREQSDPRTVTRGLHERYQNEDRATMRAIQHEQSDKRIRERYQDEYRATTRLKKLMPGTLDITVPIRFAIPAFVASILPAIKK